MLDFINIWLYGKPLKERFLALEERKPLTFMWRVSNRKTGVSYGQFEAPSARFALESFTKHAAIRHQCFGEKALSNISENELNIRIVLP